MTQTTRQRSSAKKKSKNESMKRNLTIDLRALNEEKRTVELSFSSEEPYQRWFGSEVLSHEPNAVDLSRLNDIGVVLYNHNRDKVIGRIDNAWVKDNRAYATVTFDDDDDSEIIYSKVKSGTLRAVSVGYKVDSWEEVSAGKKSADGRHLGPCSVALKWQPYEISIVSVPADSTVGVGRDLEEEDDHTEQFEKRDYSYYESQMLLNQNYIGGK
ncbi:HK97 family phage prohead protease [Psychrobacillus sp. FSL K6-1267]|uniref:HK97 family phage prohead protease n=1 Tax=Psychrobacillus sp. FSL K6-1267 TaxID=2921543 RepID=UPI0030F4E776